MVGRQPNGDFHGDGGARPFPDGQPRRVGYSVREASELLGRRTEALRREIERHARAEGEQLVARLAGGISAYRRKDGGRWLISIPRHLGA